MNTPDKDSENLGAELKKIRLEKGFSLDSLSQKTKINKKYLEAIENNRFDFLHEPYVLVFMRAYAKALGLDEEEFKERYHRQVSPQLGTAQEETRHTPSARETHIKQYNITPSEYLTRIGKLIKRYQKPIVIIMAVGLLIIVILKLFPGTEEEIILPQKSLIQNQKSPAITDTVQQKLLELRLSTRDSLWIRVIIDDSDTSENLFFAGDSSLWEAENKFELAAGRSTGFDLFFNEVPVQNLLFNGEPLRNIFNQRVMIRKLVLTKDGVVELRRSIR